MVEIHSPTACAADNNVALVPPSLLGNETYDEPNKGGDSEE